MERNDPHSLAAENLPAHLAWVRSLALALLGRERIEDAEDVAHDAIVASLSRRNPVERPRGWLRGVVVRLAWRRRRDDERRLRRESAAARPEATESALDTVERFARHRQLVAALADLDAPLREALLLRFQDGVPPREIARRLGVPVETAKTRLKRGLEQLRRRLVGVDDAGGSKLRGLLAPLVALPATEALATTGATALGSKGVSIVLALLVGGFGVWRLVERDDRERFAGAVPRIGTPAERAVAAGDSAPSRATDLASVRRVAGSPRDEPASLRPTSLLRGRVVDARGRPAGAAHVRVVRRDGELHDLGIEPYRPQWDVTVAEVATDLTGAFSVPVAPWRPHAVYVELGDELARVEPCFGDEEIEVTLAPAARLRVQIVERDGGAPIAGAVVSLRSLDFRSGSETSAVTGEDGGAGFLRLLPGRMHVDVATPASQRLVSLRRVPPSAADATTRQELVVGAGETAACIVEVKAARTLRGRIVDAESGDPIAGAAVGTDLHATPTVSTDGDGRFELPGFSSGQITVRARGYGLRRWNDIETNAASDERDFALDRGRLARGRVVDASGRPLDAVHVVALANAPDDGRFGGCAQLDVVATDTGAEGRFELRDLAPGMEHTLVFSRPGHARRTLLLPPSERFVHDVELGTIELGAPGLLAGKAVGPAGERVAGMRVTLHGLDDRWNVLQPGRSGYLPVALRSSAAERSSRLDARGRFRFDDLPAGWYRIQVGSCEPAFVYRGECDEEIDPSLRGASKFVALGSAERRDDLVLELAPLTSIAGRIVDESGARIPDAGVFGLHCPIVGQGCIAMTKAVDGEFEILGLVPGRYELTARSWNEDPDVGRHAWVPVALEVDAGARDLEIVLRRGRRVVGRVLDGRGVPVVRAALAARCAGERFGPVETGHDGTFSLVVPEHAVVEVEARRPAAHLEHRNYGFLFASDEPPQLLVPAVTPGGPPLELVLPSVEAAAGAR